MPEGGGFWVKNPKTSSGGSSFVKNVQGGSNLASGGSIWVG